MEFTGLDHFIRATQWMAVNDTDKLNLPLLVGGEELKKLLQVHYPNSPQIINRTLKC